MPISLAPIICATTFKLLLCPPAPPPPPPIEALPMNPTAAEALAWQRQPVANGTRPRNLVLFIGDGMGLTTVAAARGLAESRAAAAAAAPPPTQAADASPAAPIAAPAPEPAPELSKRAARKAAARAERIAAAQATADAARAASATPFGDDGQLGFELFPATAIGRTNL